MKNTIFTGMATAIVTPMHTDGSIDYEALGRFVEFQIGSGINGLVVMGTTGENATIEPEDQKKVIAYTVEKVAGRVPVIAGTGTNNTEHVLHNTRNACQVGADAILVVTPYYNKATQNGLVTHFTAVADESTLPVILYNVPSRTGCNLLPKTVAKLSEHPNIAAIKEATGSLAQMIEIMHLCGDKIDVYSGEDGLTVPMMANGILSGAILSWVAIVTELSSSIILYNNKSITLTMSTYVAISRGNYGLAAAFAAILTVVTTVSLLIYLAVSKSEDVSL